MQVDDLDDIFSLPLSQQALQELENLQAQLQVMPYDEEAKDQWTPIGGVSTLRVVSTLMCLVGWSQTLSSR